MGEKPSLDFRVRCQGELRTPSLCLGESLEEDGDETLNSGCAVFEVRGVLEEEHTLSDGARKTNAGWSLILEGLARCRFRCRKYNSLCCCLASFLCSPLVYRCAQFSSPDPVFSLRVLISPRRPCAGAFQGPQALIHTSHFSLSPYSFPSLPLIESHYLPWSGTRYAD